MKRDTPIFIIGSGRSGTTILYNLLSVHSKLTWISNYSDRYPKLAFLHKILDIPYVGDKMKNEILRTKDPSVFRKLIPKPDEGQNIYHNLCDFDYSKKTTEDDIDDVDVERFKDIIRYHLKINNKEHFISKQTTNNQRIRLIDHIFPDAKYIHLIRDGRAAANSMFNVEWWPETELWWADGKTPKEIKSQFEDPIQICAVNWKKNVFEILDNKDLFSDNYFEIRYEDLASDTKVVVKKIINFLNIETNKKYWKRIPNSLPNMNYKWRNLSEKRKNVLIETLRDELEELDYM